MKLIGRRIGMLFRNGLLLMDLSRLKETRATSLPDWKEEGPASLLRQLDHHDHHL
jgi:hypothetical protein